jgi:subtilisin family serine protease
MPTQPGSDLDKEFFNNGAPNRSHTTHAPYGDETQPDDGWLVASGTSSAAPQIAGICTLMKQVNPGLGPNTIRRILMDTAIDITAGHASPFTGSYPATSRNDIATGAGLADCAAAVKRSQMWPIPGPPYKYSEFDPRYLDPRILAITKSLSQPPHVPWPINPVTRPSIRAIINNLK